VTAKRASSEKWIAENACMLARVRDLCHEGFEVMLIEKGTRPITPESGEIAPRPPLRFAISMIA
jgi:hypothetical protein